jgi:hypothetical protein
MNARGRIGVSLVAAVVTLALQPVLVCADSPSAAPKAAAPPNAMAKRDGQRDFDWMVGTWKADLKRLVKPLSGSSEWLEFEGTQITRSIWGGRGVMDEFSVHSPATNTHIDGFTVRLYNPDTRQWTIYWANAKKGNFDWPAMTGEFKDGRGEFYDQEMFEGRAIFVRYVWSDIKPDSAHFEQSFSADGGKTWEPNWISNIYRVKQ